MPFNDMTPENVAALRAAVRAGLDASRQSASKWHQLYGWITETYGLAEDDVRASLLVHTANLSNRVGKDNAWTNPKVLILVMEPDGEVDLDRARSEVREYVRSFADRLDATSHLRAVLYFFGDELVAVDKLRFQPYEQLSTQYVGTSEGSTDAG